MRSSRQADALQSALQFLITSDISAEHKRVLIEAVTDRLRSLDTEDRRQQALDRDPGELQAHENAVIAEFLAGKRASSWQHADELLMSLAAQLRRDPRDVRAKATELGLGAAVDFKLAKLLREQKAE